MTDPLMTATAPAQLTLQAQGLTFRAQAWGDPTNPPVLALHGWFDNSASFYRLGPALHNVYLVALDTAGHGLSDHRAGVEPYNIWQEVADIFAIADALGWREFALLGHSRGAISSMLAAGTFPERITRLALLDGYTPDSVPEEHMPEQLARAVRDMRRHYKMLRYPDREAMIQSRMQGLWPLSRDAATALVERGSRATDGGYVWTSDPRLKAASSVKLTAGQIRAFLQRIAAPVNLLVASEGVFTRAGRQPPKLDKVTVQTLPGSHHLHMEEPAQQIAGLLSDFFAT